MSKQKKKKPSTASRQEPSLAPTLTAAAHPTDSSPERILSSAGAIFAARVCLSIAAIVALYLLWIAIRGGSVAGCGPGSDCDKVLQSRWSKWFGLPVSGFSLVIYAVLFGATLGLRSEASVLDRQRAGRVILAGAILVLGAAAWYTLVQVAVIHAICPYCMTAHVLGSAAAVLLLGARARIGGAALNEPASLKLAAVAGALLIVLIGGQVIHEPRSHIERNVTALMSVAPAGGDEAPRVISGKVTNATATPAQTVAIAPPPAPAFTATNSSLATTTLAVSNRIFSIYNGQFKFNLDEVPLLGSPAAPHLMVSLFDYTCHHCRTMHERLIEAHHTWSNELAIVILPMPLDPQCNPTMTRPHPDHINACFFGRLGLAVVRANRTKAAQFDEFVFKPERPPATNEAMLFAEQLVGGDALRRALADPWIENQLKQDVSIYEISFRAGQGSMPQSIIGNRIAVGLMRKEDLDRILGAELGLKSPAQ